MKHFLSYRRNENDIAIRIGSTTLRPDTSAREFGARKLNIHPEYNPNTIQHDIGVIKVGNFSTLRNRAMANTKALIISLLIRPAEDSNCIPREYEQGASTSFQVRY